jgi:hypothetical protein
MSDAMARELRDELLEALPPLLRPTTPLEDGLVLQVIADFARRVAQEARADAFKECLLVIQDEITPPDCGVKSYHYASCAEYLFGEIQRRARAAVENAALVKSE